jgi:glutathione S-transferase
VTELTLYDFDLDEDCYRVRLLLALLSVEAKRVAVDMIPGGEHLRPPLIALNPRGRLPVLVEDEAVACGPVAGLAFLARRFGGPAWAPPEDAAGYAAYVSWLEFAAADLAAAREARSVSLFGAAGDFAALAKQGRHALRLMEDHMTLRGLDGGVWFVGERVSIADIALFPSFALSRDWGEGHESYPALRLWLRRLRALPGFIVMPGLPDYF